MLPVKGLDNLCYNVNEVVVNIFAKNKKRVETPTENRKPNFSGRTKNTDGLNTVVRIMRRELAQIQTDMSILKRDMRRVSAKQYAEPTTSLSNNDGHEHADKVREVMVAGEEL